MERGFAVYGYLYERKVRQHDGATTDWKRIVANEIAGQSYLSVVLKRPSDARARKYKLWGEHYGSVFGGGRVEPYIIAVQVYRRAGDWVHEKGYRSAADETRRKIANNGVFHLSRVAAALWRGTEAWANADELVKQVTVLETNPGSVDTDLEKALVLLEQLVKGSAEYSGNLDAALKSNAFDGEVTKRLHAPRGSETV
jgi:hypothetical protein